MIGGLQFRLAATAIVLWLVPAVLSAQVGEIKGVARDAAGMPLPGVLIEVESSTLVEKKVSTTTDKDGKYQFEKIPVGGSYAVTFKQMGFVTFRRERIYITSGWTAAIDAPMKPGSSSEIVVVTDPEPVVEIFHAR
jgi:hypothetical protein